jgi:mannose-1-phosphate guanylyltransferase/phosphomannomutase
VIDFAYGTTVEVFPGLLGALQTDTVSLDAYAAPGRLSRNQGEFDEALARLGGIVRSIHADMGLWCDPGGEVIYLVDDSGRAVSPELTQAIFVGLALEHLGVKRVAIPVTSPVCVADIIRASGAELIWTKTEHHAMMASATQADMVAGARGEFIVSSFMPAYDGMFAAVKLLEALARSGVRLSEVANRYPPLFVRQERVACPWGRKGAVMRRLIVATEGERRQLVDGVKLWKSDREWVLIIPHSDRPRFVVTAEAESEARVNELIAQYTQLVEEWRDDA